MAKQIQETVLGIRSKKNSILKNAFVHPLDENAEIPQFSVKTPLDYRSENLQMSHTVIKGNRRKNFNDAEKAYHEEISKNHQPVKILAGKGANAEKEAKKAKKKAKRAIKKPDELGFEATGAEKDDA